MKIQILDKVRVPKGEGSYIGTVMEFDGQGLVRVGSTNIFNEHSSVWVPEDKLQEV